MHIKSNLYIKTFTVNTYFVPQGHKARTWVKPQGPNSVITCRIDLNFVGMYPQTLPTRCILTHDLMITYQGFISKNVPRA